MILTILIIEIFLISCSGESGVVCLHDSRIKKRKTIILKSNGGRQKDRSRIYCIESNEYDVGHCRSQRESYYNFPRTQVTVSVFTSNLKDRSESGGSKVEPASALAYFFNSKIIVLGEAKNFDFQS